MIALSATSSTSKGALFKTERKSRQVQLSFTELSWDPEQLLRLTLLF
jgi:hypothetical protein